MPVVGIPNFTFLTDSKIKASATCNHSIHRGVFVSDPRTWICKTNADYDETLREILAQEFFRVVIPHQPETRMAYRGKNSTGKEIYSILSEEVEGYRSLPKNQSVKFENGTYTGLGQVLVCALFLQEIDLKNGNVGLNKEGQVIKIDGDWSFSGLVEYYKDCEYKITPQSIELLPYPVDYYVFNWLDLIQENVKQSKSQIINPTALSSAPLFRLEVNQALLKICLIPDCFIESFVNAVTPTGAERFVTLIKNRRDELKQSALQNDSFNEYLKLPQAAMDADNLFTHLSLFNINSQQVIALEQSLDFKISFNSLRDLIIPPTEPVGKPLFFQEPQESTSGGLSAGSSDCLNECYQLAAPKPESNLSLKDDEAKAIKKIIYNFPKQVSFFRAGMQDEDNKIEKVRYRKLLEACQYFSWCNEKNEVKKALASHRYFSRYDVVPSGFIGMKQVANSLKVLKIEFLKQTNQDQKHPKLSFNR